MATAITDINLTTSVANFLASKFTENGWQIYWQATDITSGTATNGSITIVPEFPNEPNQLRLPPATRSKDTVVIPAFSVIVDSPDDIVRAGLGDTEFLQRTTATVEGFVVDKSQHLSFSTMFREWFRQDETCPVYNYESNPSAPPLVDVDMFFDQRSIFRPELLEVPPQARYYINMEVDLVYYD